MCYTAVLYTEVAPKQQKVQTKISVLRCLFSHKQREKRSFLLSAFAFSLSPYWLLSESPSRILIIEQKAELSVKNQRKNPDYYKHISDRLQLPTLYLQVNFTVKLHWIQCIKWFQEELILMNKRACVQLQDTWKDSTIESFPPLKMGKYRRSNLEFI